MTWTYERVTGALTRPDGSLCGTGYSGRLDGYNNPALERAHDIGPIPAGRYLIGPAVTHMLAGPVCMRLSPAVGVDTFNRDGFMAHGDTSEHMANPGPNTSCSHGCIVLPAVLRRELAASMDRWLDVV